MAISGVGGGVGSGGGGGCAVGVNGSAIGVSSGGIGASGGVIGVGGRVAAAGSSDGINRSISGGGDSRVGGGSVVGEGGGISGLGGSSNGDSCFLIECGADSGLYLLACADGSLLTTRDTQDPGTLFWVEPHCFGRRLAFRSHLTNKFIRVVPPADSKDNENDGETPPSHPRGTVRCDVPAFVNERACGDARASATAKVGSMKINHDTYSGYCSDEGTPEAEVYIGVEGAKQANKLGQGPRYTAFVEVEVGDGSGEDEYSRKQEHEDGPAERERIERGGDGNANSGGRVVAICSNPRGWNQSDAARSCLFAATIRTLVVEAPTSVHPPSSSLPLSSVVSGWVTHTFVTGSPGRPLGLGNGAVADFQMTAEPSIVHAGRR